MPSAAVLAFSFEPVPWRAGSLTMTTIPTTPAASQLNLAVEKFDKVTGHSFDRVTEPETLAVVCETHNWHGLAKEIRDAAFYVELERLARN